MSARIAEIKRILRAYGIPVGLRTSQPATDRPDDKTRTTFKAAWVSMVPDIHLEPEYRWISYASMGRYGATWENAWENLLKYIREKLMDEVKLIERERRLAKRG